jgi:hypothetical protein
MKRSILKPIVWNFRGTNTRVCSSHFLHCLGKYLSFNLVFELKTTCSFCSEPNWHTCNYHRLSFFYVKIGFGADLHERQEYTFGVTQISRATCCRWMACLIIRSLSLVFLSRPYRRHGWGWRSRCIDPQYPLSIWMVTLPRVDCSGRSDI